ncbi:hypothetical protein Pla175_45210 [Pirellulimonas nuda]|uniref:Prepilin-type N-terminal cleavage/methylation domain-containing protein n=1 Tax=Pirellulimonas nuda TaxID=2528009 RepID=A0A518DHZ6_9BACT|nr:prepilin-type N-terminal cleavage/methylation domain-containing protein [Pirellulimonas nuda]QDU91103.1 hypothetical protein Pla175_45210 [Pirellulimonas nuda]
MTRRRGLSLIELIATIAASAVLMGTATALVASLGQVDHRLRHEAASADELGRLARSIRLDLHASRAARWDEASQTLTLDGRLEYVFLPTVCRRLEAGGPAGAFRIAELSASADADPAEAGALFRIRLTRREAHKRRQEVEVVGLVGRDAPPSNPGSDP